MEHGRIGRGATEQCPGIQTDTFHAAIKQQAVELPFGIALGKEVSVTDLHGQGSLKRVDETRQLRQPIRGNGLGSLQPERRNPLDRTRVVQGKSLSERVALRGLRFITQTSNTNITT